MASFGKNTPDADAAATGPEPPAEDAADREARLARRAKGLSAFAAKLPAYLEREFPGIVLGFAATALAALRHYIEDPNEPDISWRSPWVEMPVPVAHGVRFDWEGDAPFLFTVTFGATADQTDEEVVKTTARTAGDYLRTAALYHLTHRIHYRKRGDTSTVWFETEDIERLRALPEAERTAEEAKLLAPVTFDGRAAWWGDVTGGLSAEGRAALERGLPDVLPFLRFHGTTAAGPPFTGSVVVQFHPLVADEDRREAYFPVVVGLVFDPVEEPLTEDQARHVRHVPNLVLPDPAAWSEADRATFWEKLLSAAKDVKQAASPPATTPEPPETSQTSETPQTGTEDLRGNWADDAAPPSPYDSYWADDAAPPSPYDGYWAREVGPVKPERRGMFPLAFGRTLADTEVLDLLRHVHRVRLPAKKWSTLPSWFDLIDRERDRLLAEEGERAFEDLRKTTRDLDARGPLLKRRHRSNGEAVVSLTAQAERDLKVREGLGKGFRYVDPKDFAKEYFVRLFQAGSGFVEVGLSWFGLAGPWVEEWRAELERQTKAAERDAQLDLFKELDAKRQTEVERLVARLHMLKDSRRLMEAVVGQVYKQGSTEVRVPAVAFRELLKLHSDPNWKSRVEGGLQALRACEFRVDSFGTGTKVKAYGTFIAEWRYHGAGPGDHGEGDYFLAVRPTFLGCLRAFESDRRKLPSGAEVLRLDFGKKLTEEDKATQGWGYDRKAKAHRTAPRRFVDFDAGRIFYHAAAGLSPQQENLVDFLERELTLRAAPVSRTLGDYARRKAEQAKPRALDARAPRVYTYADCLLLVEEARYHAALGNFRRNAEAGRTLYGTRRRESATGGPHAEGLLAVMGYDLRPGGAVRDRRRVVQAALEDMKAVVVDYLGGVVAARHSGRWLTLEEASALNEEDLGKRVRWFLFVPETWTADRRRKWEETTGWTATEDPEEVKRALLELRDQAVPPSGDPERLDLAGLPLRLRLQMARNSRGLTTRQAAALFGVSQPAYTKWETGADPDPETGKVRGKPVPVELVPLVLRWIETGETPTPEELAARRTRRAGVKAAGAEGSR